MQYYCNRCMYSWNTQPICPMCSNLYTHSRKGSDTLKINYTKNGYPVSDFKCEDLIMTKYNDGEDIETSSSILILVARALIHKGDLDYTKVEFLFEGESIGYCNSAGKLPYHPNGYCDIMDKMLEIIIDI